jgi:hypothetical protein
MYMTKGANTGKSSNSQSTNTSTHSYRDSWSIETFTFGLTDKHRI